MAPNNSSEVLIYDTSKDQDITRWKLIHVLEEHSQQVSGLDWNETTNKIISCGHDKNVIVYSFESSNKWTPALVIVSNLDRAALCARWNKSGTIFGVGSGNKRIFLGYYEPSNKWWTSVTFKVHKSSVVAIAFHPTEHLIASASTDKKIIISSCYVPEADPSGKEKGESVFFQCLIGSLLDAIVWNCILQAGLQRMDQRHRVVFEWNLPGWSDSRFPASYNKYERSIKDNQYLSAVERTCVLQSSIRQR